MFLASVQIWIFSIPEIATAVNMRLGFEYGLLGQRDLSFSPRRVVYHNVLVDFVAAEAEDALGAELEGYDRNLFLSGGGEQVAQAADRLRQQLQTARDDFARIREALEHERARGSDCSHHGFALAVTEFERPLSAATAVSQRMAYVLKNAKPGPSASSQHQQQQKQSSGFSGRGNGGFWAKRRQELKAKKAKPGAGAVSGSGKAPFLGYSGKKKN